MKFTLSKPLQYGSLVMVPGETIQLFPRKDTMIHMQKDGKDYIIGPIIFKYLHEVETPSLEQLINWSDEVLCESPTGHLVELDGTGPDGFHSWFKYLHFL